MNEVKTISRETYNDLRAKIKAYDDYIKRNYTRSNGWAVYKESEIPVPAVSNAERSQVEVYEFVHNPPKKYFLYIKRDGPKALSFTAITWTGDTLGRGLLKPKRIQNNFGGYRYSLVMKGIDGRAYYGTYYASSGTYALVYPYKNQKKDK